MEFKEFEPRFKSAKTRFKLSAGLNLETFAQTEFTRQNLTVHQMNRNNEKFCKFWIVYFFYFIHLFIVIDLGDEQQAQGKPYALQD